MNTQTTPKRTFVFDDIYKLLMREIEPELLPENFAKLDATFAALDDEGKKKLGEHYKACMETFAQKFDALMEAYSQHANKLKKEAQTFFEQKDVSNELKRLTELEQFFAA